MIDRDDDDRQRVGLCFGCRSARRVTSAKGSTFFRCARAKGDPAYRDYPPLPVRACHGFERLEERPDPTQRD
jgi:hypothetical protein